MNGSSTFSINATTEALTTISTPALWQYALNSFLLMNKWEIEFQ